MQTLNRFKFGWPALNDALAQIVTAINRNSPLEGAGITLTEHGEQGVSINAAAKKSNQKEQGGGGGGGGVLQQITVFDASGNPVTLNVFTDGQAPAVASGIQWQQVETVDSATCAHSTITVLEKGSQ